MGQKIIVHLDQLVLCVYSFVNADGIKQSLYCLRCWNFGGTQVSMQRWKMLKGRQHFLSCTCGHAVVKRLFSEEKSLRT